MPSQIATHRRQAFESQAGRCFYCQVRMWLSSPTELPVHSSHPAQYRALQCTAEHLQARSDGGPDRAENIVAACYRCNSTRHRRKRPPEPEAYRVLVERRVDRGAWHPKRVFELGLLPTKGGRSVPVGNNRGRDKNRTTGRQLRP